MEPGCFSDATFDLDLPQNQGSPHNDLDLQSQAGFLLSYEVNVMLLQCKVLVVIPVANF